MAGAPETAASLRDAQLRRIERSFASMPERYRASADGFELLGERDFDAAYEIRLGDVGRAWQVRARPSGCAVHLSPAREPDVVIGTDASTWLALREGRLSSLDAFASRRLYARGDLELALAFEGLFELPGGRQPLVSLRQVNVGGTRISTLSSGRGEPVICIHGLGANKVSFFETLAALGSGHAVHAIDLPGFGSSSKPARAAYDAAYFADSVTGLMDALEVDSAHLVGNSMGGRIALEVALRSPGRVRSLSLLAPALAFLRRRKLVPLVKLIRPELAAVPHPLRPSQVRSQVESMFARPERLDPVSVEIACEQFCRSYRSRSARVAFYAAARNIYLDPPHGERGLWTRLRALELPSTFVWGSEDRLVPAGFSRHVAEALPGARQVVLEDCGHVPQIELPERTHRLIAETIASGASRGATDPVPLGQAA